MSLGNNNEIVFWSGCSLTIFNYITGSKTTKSFNLEITNVVIINSNILEIYLDQEVLLYNKLSHNIISNYDLDYHVLGNLAIGNSRVAYIINQSGKHKLIIRI